MHLFTGEQRETWCAVEKMKEECFCRKQRKHFDSHLRPSTETGQAPDIVEEPRCEWQPGKPVLKERKHFSHTCEWCLS